MPALRLKGSRDPVSGEVYVPPRQFTADGSLRDCTPIDVDAAGKLYSWTLFRGEHYGIIDLDGGGRIQAYLDSGPHEINAHYVAREFVVESPIERARFYRD